MRYMICYDITDDGKRERTRKTLLEYGERVQYSVFECTLSPSRVGELKSKLKEIMDPDKDSVRFYPLCSACSTKILIDGAGSVQRDESFVIV